MAKHGKPHSTQAARPLETAPGLRSAIDVVRNLGFAEGKEVIEPLGADERIAYVGCPLCDSEHVSDSRQGRCTGHPLYQRALSSLIPWKRCEDCGHVFTEGYYTEAACRLIYSRTNDQQQVGFDLERQRVISARVVEKVLPHVKEGTWLDVGFGNGALLFTAQEYGFTPVGLDLRPRSVEQLASLGIACHCVDLAAWHPAATFSVISMADVLEHMPFPRPALQAAARLLDANGVLFLSMPNMDTMVWRILDQNGTNPYWGELEHYHNFSRSRLYALLREAGFEPVSYGISERYRACMEVVARKA